MSQNLLSLDTVFACINALSAIAESEAVPLQSDLYGRFLFQDIDAKHDVPPFENSAVDGFALPVAAQAGAKFHCTQYLPAGENAAPLGAGETAQVFTGGAIPANTAAVIMREEVETRDGDIHLKSTAKAGAHIRQQGEDFARAAVMLHAGTRLDSRHIAALAVAGVAELTLARPLSIGVFSAGNEVQDFGTSLQKGAIHDGNRPALISLLRRFGMTVTDLGIVPDRQDAMLRFIQQHQENFDVLFASAGMSESDTDHTARALQDCGEVIFWQLAIKPARPVGLARLDHHGKPCYVLGLPGNPASCLLAAWLIGLPLVRRLCGGVAELPRGHSVKMGFSMTKKPHRREFVRVQCDARNVAHRVLPTGSATLSSFVAADGVLDLPEGQEKLEIGDQVVYYPFMDF